MSPHTSPATPQATLSTTDAIGIIIGIVIGAGIFKMPALVASNVPDEGTLIALWLIGGVISLIGALCYAELATHYPSSGGDYHFLYRAYGARLAFLFAWSRATVITTGAIAALGFLFGDYATRLLPLGPYSSSIYAALLIILLTLINWRGIRQGTATQNWLTVLEVGGLIVIIVAGLALVTPGIPTAPVSAMSTTPWYAGIGLAMVFVLFTYSGWNEAAYLSAEIKHRERNIVRALASSIVLITLLYLLVNWAYLRALGLPAMAQSQAVAADLLQKTWGDSGALLITLLVMISAATSANATIIVGARSNYALGRDWSFLSLLGQWNERAGTPIIALLIQSGIALLLVLLGSFTQKGFQSMIEFTSPVFWFFFLLVGLSLFILRHRDQDRQRFFRVPLYPLTPILFCLTCAYLLHSSLAYAGINAWIGVAVISVGALVLLIDYLYARRSR